MSIFALSGVVGIAAGPLIGGAITSGKNWRWVSRVLAQEDARFINALRLFQIYWIQLIVDAALLPLFYVILTETRGDVILARRAARMRKAGHLNAYAKSELEKVSILQNIKVSFMRPTKMLATEFVVIVSMLGSATTVLSAKISFLGIHSLGQLRLGHSIPLPKQRPHRIQSSLRLQYLAGRPSPVSTCRRSHSSDSRQPHSR